MDEQRSDRARLAVASVAAFAGVFAFAFSKIASYDFWWRLALGRRVFTGGGIGGPEPFAYTFADRSLIQSDWMFNAFIYLVWSIVGFAGLPAVKALLFGIAAVSVLRWLSRRGAAPFAALWLILAAAAALRYRLFLRPDFVSLLLLGFVFVLADRAALQRSWLYVVVPVFALWSNIHDLVLLGFVPIVSRGAEALIDPAARRERRYWPWIGTAAAGFLASLLNPWPGHYLKTAFFQAAPDIGASPEAAPLGLGGHTLIVFLFAVCTAALFAHRKEKPWRQAITVAVFAAAALKHARLGAYFAVAAVFEIGPLLAGFKWPARNPCGPP
ncbi:MAG: hypothetical protein M5R36_14055 [Deltaproteobacteria bacterium]|nr:hypothetical protein [Deltaproteobacteria bacterium]